MTADVIPLRPRASGDAEALWNEMQAARQALAEQMASGHFEFETACRCADAYRAWLRAYTRDRIA